MPELPEVETLRRDLAAHLMGAEIEDAQAFWPGCLGCPTPGGLSQALKGRIICSLSRRGKYLVFQLDQGALLFHLGMSGLLLLAPAGGEPGKYTRLLLKLANGRELRFDDARKFGRVHLVEDAAEVLDGLGPEPLDKGFTPGVLGKILADHKACLKTLLLDQRRIAGLGNIYGDEALFRAGLHPLTPAYGLDETDIARLCVAIQEVLERAIANRGTTLPDRTYRDAAGEEGRNQAHLAVYGREGEPCPRCGTPIARIRLQGRSTHFCPSCQKPKGGER